MFRMSNTPAHPQILSVKRFVPRMGGAWSIWLVSTIMGLKHFTFEGFIASILVLLSIQPFLKKERKAAEMIPPLALTVAVIYGIYKNPFMGILILPYLILLSLFLVHRNSRKTKRTYIQMGAVTLTIPFPLMVGFHEGFYVVYDGFYSGSYEMLKTYVLNIAIPWLLLILITIFNVLLADSVIFEGGLTIKNYITLALLTLSFVLLSPPHVFGVIVPLAILLSVVAGKLSLKKLGFSLLGFHILFAVEYLVFF
jgi:hypothetical protein